MHIDLAHQLLPSSSVHELSCWGRHSRKFSEQRNTASWSQEAKDEPRANNFYYGEMEMRRHAGHPTDNPTGETSRGQVARTILTIYWLVSGYGLRAWRALAWLAGLIAGFAVAFQLAGFTRPPQPESYWTSLLYAFRATLSLTDPDVQLTAWGKLLQALLRLTGPVLLALALLAIRTRTKR